jgi:hypothetical protein
LVDVLHFQLETCQQALVNGTRMRIKFMYCDAIDCEVLTGTARNKMILIPRINLTNIRKNCNFTEAAGFYTMVNCTWQQVEFDHSMVGDFRT